MNYGFREDQVEQAKGSFPAAPSVDNVELEKIEYVFGSDKTGQVYEAIDFFYTRKLDGGREQVVKDRMFTVNESRITPSPTLSLEEAKKKAYSDFNSRLLHVASAFKITREEIQDACGSTKTFKELVEAYNALVASRAKGVKVYLKTFADKEGYPKVAAFPDFIQPMSDGESSLKYTKWELKKASTNAAPANGIHEDSPPPDWTNVEEDKF